MTDEADVAVIAYKAGRTSAWDRLRRIRRNWDWAYNVLIPVLLAGILVAAWSCACAAWACASALNRIVDTIHLLVR